MVSIRYTTGVVEIVSKYEWQLQNCSGGRVTKRKAEVLDENSKALREARKKQR